LKLKRFPEHQCDVCEVERSDEGPGFYRFDLGPFSLADAPLQNAKTLQRHNRPQGIVKR